MKRSRGCRSDMQLVPEQPFVLQAKTGRWMCSFKRECLKTEVLGYGKRQEQYRLGRIPGCATGFLGTQLLRAAPGRLCFPLLLPGMSFGKHSAIEQRVSCRDWCCHCCGCLGRAPLQLPSGCPQGLPKYRWVPHQGILYSTFTEESAQLQKYWASEYGLSQQPEVLFLLFLLYRTAE